MPDPLFIFHLPFSIFHFFPYIIITFNNSRYLSTARKVLSNTIYQLIGRFFMALLAVVILKLLTRYLGVSGYGEYVTIYEYLGFFAIFADMGIYTIAVREMSADEKNSKKIIGNIMALRTTLAIIILILAVGTAFLIPQYQNTKIPIGILIASLTTMFTMLQNTLCSILQVHYRMQYSMWSMILNKIFTVSYAIAIIYYFYPATGIGPTLAIISGSQSAGTPLILKSLPLQTGFWQLIIGGLFGSIIMFSITNHYAKKCLSFQYRWDFSYWKKILITAIPYGLAIILNNIYFKVDIVLLSLILDQKKAATENGIYGVAMRILEMLVIIPVYFMNSVLPIMMRYIKEESAKLQILIQHSFDFLLLASFPILAGLGLLATPVITLISTNDFAKQGSDIALQILIFALVFSFINSLFGFILVALGRQIKLLWINSGCVLLNIITNLIFIPLYGFRGAAVTSVISEFFILIATYLTTRYYLKFKISFNNASKIFLSAIIMGLSVETLKPLLSEKNWLLLIPLGVVVYILSLVITGVINKQMWQMIRKN